MKTAIRTSVQRSLDRRSILHRAERWVVRHGFAPTGLWYFSRIDGEFPVRTDGGKVVRYAAIKDDLIAPWLYWRGYIMNEQLELAVFSRLIAGASHFVDVGAYTGYYSLVAALENPSVHVTAIEPFPPNFERLSVQLAVNDVADRVDARNVAVADTVGVLRFGMPADEGMPVGGRITDSSESGLVYTEVATTTLDAVLADTPMVDAMKIDVEGTEASVIQGAVATLERCHPTLLMESFESTEAEPYEATLRDLGYRFYRLVSDRPVAVEHLAEAGPWDNYLCVARPQVEDALGLSPWRASADASTERTSRGL